VSSQETTRVLFFCSFCEQLSLPKRTQEIPQKEITMLVSSFMIPREKVVACTEYDSIQSVVERMLQKKISCIVVIGADGKPQGIVTKSDLAAAYAQNVPVYQKITMIMMTDIKTILDTDHRDQAAAFLDRNGFHHAVVVNKEGDFVGIISTWDIIEEVAKDANAWYVLLHEVSLSHSLYRELCAES
jgi:CBS domain-containing protein